MKKKFLDSNKLIKLDKRIATTLKTLFEKNGFNSSNLLKIFGKEVTRHININSREVYYLRSQILYNKPNLLSLVDLFLQRIQRTLCQRFYTFHSPIL